ncbi:hypothetical protein ACFQ1S_18960 [Kibdelosporangium lantanae]|uniref:Uncharacterized protein n=1 Tax=Kibdelosporangium lantanae TaxID=1497396 RepID=A0ABW3MEN6_9PSEU
MPDRHEQRRPDHDRLTAAAVTGLIAGAVRALADWLLQHLLHS